MRPARSQKPPYSSRPSRSSAPLESRYVLASAPNVRMVSRGRSIAVCGASLFSCAARRQRLKTANASTSDSDALRMSRQNSGSPQESSSERSQRRVRVLELLSRSSGKVLLGHTNGDVTTHLQRRQARGAHHCREQDRPESRDPGHDVIEDCGMSGKESPAKSRREKIKAARRRALSS